MEVLFWKQNLDSRIEMKVAVDRRSLYLAKCVLHNCSQLYLVTIICALVTSHINHCDVFYLGMPMHWKLVQCTGASLLTSAGYTDLIISL